MHRIFSDFIYDIQRKRRKEEESVSKLWDYLDSLQDEDREIIFKLLENGNEPIIRDFVYRMPYGNNGFLASEKHLKAKTFRDEDSNVKIKYVLDESFYTRLKFVKKKYGKLSHF